ncbi:hypothetical protein ACFQX7_05200 [Luedemannella flava]
MRGYTPVPAAVAWAVAAVGAGFLAYLWVVFLRPTPIVPGGEDQALYVDLPFQLSLAGEAKHHFPMHVPQVAGEPLHYHVFAFAHQAMASLVSGVDLTAVVFRLDVPALCLLAIVALVVTGWRVSGRAWVGVGAAALTFTVGEFGFADPVTFPFGTIATFIVWSSQSMTYSWVLLIAVVGVLADLVARGPEHRVPALGRGGWVLFTLLAVASVGAKASSLPVALGGLAVLGAWRLVTRRRIGWEVAAASGIGVAAQVFGNAVLFAFETHGMTVRPLWGPDRFFPEGGGAAAVAGIALAFTAVMLLRLAGLPVLLRLRGRRLGDAEVLLTGGMLAGIGAYLVFAHPGDANQYFIRAGWMFGVVASAWGWVLAAERSGLAGSGAAARQWRGWLAFGAALVCLGLLWAQFTYAADQTAAAGAFGPLVPALSWLLVLAIVAAVAGLWWRAVATGPLRDLRGRGGFVLLTAVLLAGAPGLVMEARTGWSHPNGGGYARWGCRRAGSRRPAGYATTATRTTSSPRTRTASTGRRPAPATPARSGSRRTRSAGCLSRAGCSRRARPRRGPSPRASTRRSGTTSCSPSTTRRSRRRPPTGSRRCGTHTGCGGCSRTTRRRTGPSPRGSLPWLPRSSTTAGWRSTGCRASRSSRERRPRGSGRRRSPGRGSGPAPRRVRPG